MAGGLLVLGWHNVEGTDCFSSRPGRGRAGLLRQLTTLAKVATVVPLGQALADLDAGRELPPRAAALTFDDGYADVLSMAVPILERLGLPATFFLVPGLLDREVTAWWEHLAWAFHARTRDVLTWGGGRWSLAGSRRGAARAASAVGEQLKRLDAADRSEAVADLIDRLAPAGKPPSGELFLDWPGARQLVRRGFDVGSHTMAHAILSREDAATQHADLARSRARLQDVLQVPADLLAYPNGRSVDFDSSTVAAAAAAGHTHAVTTIEGFHRRGGAPYEVRRSVVYPERGVTDLLVNARYAWRSAS